MPTEKTPTLDELAAIAAKDQQADIYLYNGPINDAGHLRIIGAVAEPHHTKKAVLLITTYGGSAEAAYRIARWFQRFYDDFWLYPTYVCASAGTLIAIGANGLYMSPISELGPLDVQLSKRNELGETKSGLVTKAALERLQEVALSFWEHFMLEIDRKGQNLAFDTCSKIASSVCSTVFGELYKKIDPEILGQDDRDLKVAQEYGNRLMKHGKNISEAMIKKLVNDYPSHDFVIDSEESRTLFQRVEFPPESIMNVALALGSRAFAINPHVADVARMASLPATTAVAAIAENDPQENSNVETITDASQK